MDSLREVVMENVDILAIAETKINESFSTAQILLVGYHSPYGLDKSHKSGGILVYVKSSIPFRQLNFPNLPYKIQAIPFQLNLKELRNPILHPIVIIILFKRAYTGLPFLPIPIFLEN